MKTKNLHTKIAAVLLFMTAAPMPGSSQNTFWNIQGNTGTNSSSHFAGTRDSTDFVIRTNKIRRITVKANGNTGIGVFSVAYKLDVGGDLNIRSGFGLYLSNQKFLSTTGNKNMFLGYHAGENSNGFDNMMIGESSGQNGGGFHNSIIGTQAGMNNYGANNTFCGYRSGWVNTSGTYNAFFGLGTGYSNTSGDGNSLFGQNVLFSNVTGSWNCSYGFESGNYTTTSFNCFYGTQTGLGNVSGSQNTFIGYRADANGSDYVNSTALGNLSQITGSNQVRLGNSAVTSIGGFADWSNISDGRFKTNIQENVPGLDFIKQLKPVTYNLNVTGINKFLHPKQDADKTRRPVSQTANDQRVMAEKEKIVYSGFVAQQVEAAAKKAGYNFSGIDAPKNENDLYGLRYAQFVIPLVKAVQELAVQNDELKKQLTVIQDQLNELLLKNNFPGTPAINSLAPRLEQNNPNPFRQTCSISYFIPENAVNPVLNIYSASGRLMKSYAVAKSGSGQVRIKENTLAAGLYYYTLIINNKTVDSKQMILTR